MMQMGCTYHHDYNNREKIQVRKFHPSTSRSTQQRPIFSPPFSALSKTEFFFRPSHFFRPRFFGPQCCWPENLYPCYCSVGNKLLTMAAKKTISKDEWEKKMAEVKISKAYPCFFMFFFKFKMQIFT